MSGEGKRSDGLLGESDYERRRSLQAPSALHATALLLDSTQPFFYSKLYLRILRPNWPTLLPDDDALPRSLRDALNHLDAEIHKRHQEAAIAA